MSRKTPVDRIQFYTRKAAELSRIPIFKRKPGSTRLKRLLAYKKLLMAELEP
jgi:hypothetical protein